MDGLEPTNETGIEYHINSADEKAAAMRRILPDLAADSPLLTGTVDEMYEGLSRILPALRSNATHLSMSRQQLTSDQQRDRAHRLDQAAYVYRDFARGFDATDPAKAEEARRLATSLQMQGAASFFVLTAMLKSEQNNRQNRKGRAL